MSGLAGSFLAAKTAQKLPRKFCQSLVWGGPPLLRSLPCCLFSAYFCRRRFPSVCMRACGETPKMGCSGCLLIHGGVVRELQGGCPQAARAACASMVATSAGNFRQDLRRRVARTRSWKRRVPHLLRMVAQPTDPAGRTGSTGSAGGSRKVRVQFFCGCGVFPAAR